MTTSIVYLDTVEVDDDSGEGICIALVGRAGAGWRGWYLVGKLNTGPLSAHHYSRYCYIMADGWDAMEGSVSGNGCRPTIGAMMYSEAMAIAGVANATGNMSLFSSFSARAGWIKEWYLSNLWSDTSGFLGVYKQGVEFSGMGGCTSATQQNKTDAGCCCVAAGSPLAADPHYKNFTICPGAGTAPAQSPGNITACPLARYI